MKKDTESAHSDMRADYKREDLGPVVRGKYAARVVKTTNIVVIDPALAKAFPNSDAVNDALRGLLRLASTAVRPVATARKVSRTKTSA